MSNAPNFWVVTVITLDNVNLVLSEEAKDRILYAMISGDMAMKNKLRKLYEHSAIAMQPATILNPAAGKLITELLRENFTNTNPLQILCATEEEYKRLKTLYDRDASPERK